MITKEDAIAFVKQLEDLEAEQKLKEDRGPLDLTRRIDELEEEMFDLKFNGKDYKCQRYCPHSKGDMSKGKIYNLNNNFNFDKLGILQQIAFNPSSKTEN